MEQKKYWHVTFFFFFIFLSLFLLMILQSSNAEWLNHGGNLANTRSYAEPLLNRADLASHLQLKWKFNAGDDITATPAISNGVVYFPSWNGNLYAVNAFNGDLIWTLNIAQITGGGGGSLQMNSSNSTIVSRTTPTVAGDLLIVGINGPAIVIAINRFNARLVWLTRIDPHPLAQITMSGTAYLGGFYVGVSSSEAETLSTSDHYQCCTFQGSIVKLDITTGTILWQTSTLPDNGGNLGGYAGAAVSGSSPAIDVIRNVVYIATGNLYKAPDVVSECWKNQTKAAQPDHCVTPDVHFDSILALSLDHGNVTWSKRFGGYDVSYFLCLGNYANCSSTEGHDYLDDAEFVEDPMLVTISDWNGRSRDVVVAVQKSGFVWALDRDNGDILWFNATGGSIWGAATDGKRVYTTNTVNNNGTNSTSTQNTTFSGKWVALNADTGTTEWSISNPINETSEGPFTLVNDNILFAGSVAPSGPFSAIDGQTGNILWTYNTGAPICGGASVSYGCVYIGHGCSFSNIPKSDPTWTRGTSLFAFCPI